MEEQRMDYTEGTKYYRYEHNTRTYPEHSIFMLRGEIF